ncbi:hypothetical protein Verru16b_00761 [Lacunisphaera limnophila]|uniref:Uncharacterized protein n=1 Tax=Lacunisphaera limnophila TaxID=1838286 RepID=A0A1D8AS38_9BACT|nr:hypothetical protein [Lacunisphaera limnophila]AOS43708.1 hypothetical protein Verru16b_00761 [Lacunisphaera limnophila]
MSTEFPFVVVPEELHKVFGVPVPGTHLFHKEGPQEETSFWADAVFHLAGPCVSPGGVSMYAPVSRAAVHKRLKDGKLSGFFFHINQRKRNFFGVDLSTRELAIGYIPVSECKAWKAELEQRAIDQGIVTEKELLGDKPDWHGHFLSWNSRWAKEQARKAKGGKK